MGLGSNNNANIFNKCSSLKNLIVTFQANSDLIVQGNNGFSLQLNCYPQTKPQATYEATGAPLNWFQYVINVSNEQVQAGIQYWAVQPQYKGKGFSPSPNYVQFASAPSNQLLRGSVLRIQLETDSSDNVWGATFGLIPGGSIADFKTGSRYQFDFPTNCRCAIYGFQVNLVGPADGTHTCKFASCLGILTYSASNSLTVQTTNDCGGYGQPGTGETSNSVYGGVLPTAGSWDLSQTVGIA